MGVYANQEVDEGTVTTTKTITLARRSRTIEIINDSGTRDLQYKFNNGETYSTLKPLEVVSMFAHIRSVYLNSPSSVSVAYRIRVLGLRFYSG